MPVKRAKKQPTLMAVDRATVEDIARTAARDVLHEYTTQLASTIAAQMDHIGIETANPEAMRRDFAHLRRWTEVMAVIRSQGVASFIKYLIAGTFATIVVGLGVIFARH